MTNWVAAPPGEMEFKKTPTEYGETVRSRFTVSAALKRTEQDSQNWGFWEGCTDEDRQKAKRTYHRRLRSWRIVQTSRKGDLYSVVPTPGFDHDQFGVIIREREGS